MADKEVMALVEAFGQAWNDHDLDVALAMTAADCVFESTGPSPDGERHVGRDAVREAWKPVFDDPSSHFEVEDSVVAPDTVVQRWRYDWADGHVRGIDVIVVRDGRIAQKLSYVKG
jgi:uncharacterized protein (TIGR02246 family)